MKIKTLPTARFLPIQILKRSHDDDGLFFLSCNDIARIIKFKGRPFTEVENM